MKSAHTMPGYWLILSALALCGEPDSPTISASRRYEAGPLSAADFAAAPPAERGRAAASTHSGIEYTFQYRLAAAKKGVRVVATHLETYATVTPAKSWNLAPDNARLLDHEQGHFDITQRHALNWRRQAASLMAKGALTGQGPTQEAAYQALQARIETELDAIKKAWEAEQALYDKETDHGRRADSQARWRERLDRELAATKAGNR